MYRIYMYIYICIYVYVYWCGQSAVKNYNRNSVWALEKQGVDLCVEATKRERALGTDAVTPGHSEAVNSHAQDLHQALDLSILVDMESGKQLAHGSHMSDLQEGGFSTIATSIIQSLC